MSGSLTEAFGVQTDVTATDAPKGTSLEADRVQPRHTGADDGERGSPAHGRLGLEHARPRPRAAPARAQSAGRRGCRPSAGAARGVPTRHRRRPPADSPGRQQRRDPVAREGLVPFGQRSARSRTRAQRLLEIGELVAGMTGAITVSGHTDNVPIRDGGVYRSNWELSAARAASVGHELLGRGARARAAHGQRARRHSAACRQ